MYICGRHSSAASKKIQLSVDTPTIRWRTEGGGNPGEGDGDGRLGDDRGGCGPIRSGEARLIVSP